MPRSLSQRVRRRLRMISQSQWIAYWRDRPVRPDTVLYEAFSGNGMLCNPEAIFRGLLDAPDMRHLTHIWVLSDPDRYQETIERYRDHHNVHFVRYDSPAYHRALATSQYLVNNATFPWQFAKRDGQTYLNTWHGTPLKRMGYDVAGGGPDTRNVIRNFLQADYLLSGNEFTTRQMYETGYKLRGIYQGAILQEGLPRIDRQYLSGTEHASLRTELRARGVAVADAQRIVLYAPTWRGSSFYSPRNNARQLREVVHELNEQVRARGWRVLLKVHQTVSSHAARDPELRESLVPNDIPTNVLLGTSDALVTDYSSICYDFLATGRPVLFFVPDLDAYTGSRGLYVEPANWPGPVTGSLDTLAHHINGLGTGGEDDVRVSFASRYGKAVDDYCPREDGNATRRVLDVVFRGVREGYDVREDFSDGRESILIYLGGLRSNGINSSVLNLLNTIDHNRFDVSALYSYQSRSRERRASEAAINPNVRLFPHTNGFNGSKRYTLGRRRLLRSGAGAWLVDLEAQRRLFRDEWTRCFGPSTFDYIVDFSGYSPMWAFLLLQGKARSHTIWMHNDMAADRMRTIDGHQPMAHGLGALFSLYRYFDKLVSVSPALSEVNRAHFAGQAGDARFVSALNTIDHQRILRMASEPAGRASSGPGRAGPGRAGPNGNGRGHHTATDALFVPGTGDPVVGAVPAGPLDGRPDPLWSAGRVSAGQPIVTTFVTVGRLSPEKNHARMIRAFQVVHREHPYTRLIVIGRGPLRRELDELIAEEGLDGAVIMAGHQANPYAVMAMADCFVLSSDYEGQPMAILEARVLGLPVVSTDFDSVRGVLPEDVGVVVPRTVTDLARGMTMLLDGRVPNPPFDYVAYNRRAIAQFYRAIGASPDAADPAPAAPAGDRNVRDRNVRDRNVGDRGITTIR